MSTNDTSFGILTLAAPNDYLKAIGFALSVRASNPGVPIAVACSKKLQEKLKPHFDYVIEEVAGLRGFAHKVHLDEYTPFDNTFFFDSDVLIFRPVEPYVALWGTPAYSAVGWYETGGFSTFGLDRARVLSKMGKDKLTVIDGAGHACFNKATSRELFNLAREITANYAEWGEPWNYADEDAVAIAMTILGLPPSPYGDFFSRYLSAKPGTMKMDASKAHCRFIFRDTGLPFEPCMMHFAANEAPFPYFRQLFKLFHAAGVPTDGLLSLATDDCWEAYFKIPLNQRLGAIRKRLRG